MFPGENKYMQYYAAVHTPQLLVDLGPSTSSEQTVSLKQTEQGCSWQEDQRCPSPSAAPREETREFWNRKPMFCLAPGRERSASAPCLCQSAWASLPRQGKGSTRRGKSIVLENPAARDEDVSAGIVGQIESGKTE